MKRVAWKSEQVGQENWDIDWLMEQADDPVSRNWITTLHGWRKKALEHNDLPQDRSEITLSLGGYEVHVEACAAFNALEVFLEIFRQNGHRLAPGFLGSDACTLVDLGANFGFYALRMKSENPSLAIVCVEPNPYVFPYLKKNLQVNGARDAVCFSVAVGKDNSRRSFDLVRQIPSISGRGIAQTERRWIRSDFVETVEIEFWTLSKLIQASCVDTIGILKIDVEGEEHGVISDFLIPWDRIQKIVVERHSRKLRKELVLRLRENGFKLVFEEDPGFQRYYGDLYFVTRELDPKLGSI
ncbi:MAG: FkbM family methyltransferase [Desulfomonilaceae bacterium]